MADSKESKQTYPFVNARKMESFVGSTVALVGKVDKVESSTFTVKTTDGKSFLNLYWSVDKEVSVVGYRPNPDS